MNPSHLYQHRKKFILFPLMILALLAMGMIWKHWPIPSSKITITAGSPEGVYYANAQRYIEKFAAYGVTLEVLSSAGSAQNLQRLQDPQHNADLGFIQGGFGYLGNFQDTQPVTNLQTLANVDIEPVWIFTNKAGIDSLAQIKGQRVSLGAQGSGSRIVALSLLEQMRVQTQDIVVSDLSGMAGATALQKGQLDVMLFVSAPSGSVVRTLMVSPGIYLIQLKHSAALAERVPYLEPQLLPQGKFDASGKYPNKDITLLTTSASLVAKTSLATPLKRIATQVAKEVHQSAGILNQAREFPSLRRVDFATASHSRDVLSRGLNWIEATFPFWWAQFIQRVLLICLPVALVALWLSRAIPSYLLWQLKAQVNRWYGELKFIEHDLLADKVYGLNLAAFNTRLQQIDSKLAAFNAPAELTPHFYTLRQHCDFVFRDLQKKRGR